MSTADQFPGKAQEAGQKRLLVCGRQCVEVDRPLRTVLSRSRRGSRRCPNLDSVSRYRCLVFDGRRQLIERTVPLDNGVLKQDISRRVRGRVLGDRLLYELVTDSRCEFSNRPET